MGARLPGPAGRAPRPNPPGWLVALGAPLGAGAAWVVGGAEHAVMAARLAASESAALGGTGAGGGALGLALLPAVLDVAAVALALTALQRGLARRRRMDGGFPWAPLAALVSANVLCLGCLRALGAVTVWGSALALGLWGLHGAAE